MRVLWLTPIQLPSVRGVPPTSGGWMEGLRRALEAHEPQVELVIASLGPVRHKPFRQGNAEYHLVVSFEARGRFDRVRRRWSHNVVPDGALESSMRIIDATDPDLIHVHGSENYLGLVLRECAIPAVVSLQGIASAYFPHFAAGMEPGDFLRALYDPAFLRGLGLIHEYFGYRSRVDCELEVIRNCDTFLGRTDWDRRVLEYLRPDARYYHVGEVLDEVFYRECWEADAAQESLIYCTSRSSPLKALPSLLDAVAILRRTTRPHLRLRVGGPMKGGALWPAIRRRLQREELHAAIDLLGVLRPTEIADELKRASLFAYASHIDNSPNALCEAMLMGVPCVASNVGGVPSLVKDGGTGLLYQDRDPFMLAAAIDRLMDDSELAARLGRAARAEALVRHDREHIAHRVAEVYAEVIHAHPS